MARTLPLAAQLIADLFVAIEQDDLVATLEATHALADRIGVEAASAISRALLADRYPTPPQHTLALPDVPIPLVACA